MDTEVIVSNLKDQVKKVNKMDYSNADREL